MALKPVLSKVSLPKYGQKLSFDGFEIAFTGIASLFLQFGGYFESIESTVAKYGRKRSFACFENGLSVFTLLFLALYRLFLVDRWYHCQDKGVNVHSPAFK